MTDQSIIANLKGQMTRFLLFHFHVINDTHKG